MINQISISGFILSGSGPQSVNYFVKIEGSYDNGTPFILTRTWAQADLLKAFPDLTPEMIATPNWVK